MQHNIITIIRNSDKIACINWVTPLTRVYCDCDYFLKICLFLLRVEPLMVIVEFCSYGDLQSYLRHCRGVEDKYYQDLYKVPIEKLGSRDLLSFAIQTARGMAHLAGMKVKTILI